MDYRKLLNEKQFEAVSTNSQYVRIVAGAGSGKTRTLTHRIAYLIGELGFRPSSILAITFTNKAAKEMKERTINILQMPEAGRMFISTFHSFCARFLRQEIEAIGFANNFQIIDDDDQEQIVKDIAVNMGFKKNDPMVKYAISFICRNKCLGRYPDQVKIKKDDAEDKIALDIFDAYEDEKDKMNKLDFDDLLLRSIQVLEEDENVRSKWQRKFSNILIDEFQDTNDVQFKLVKLLLSGHNTLYVVGDPDQTVYTWRGANQNIILSFETTFPNAETIILNENYRSTKPILDAANKLIAHNKKRVPKDLYTNVSGGDQPKYQFSMSKEGEARNIATQIEILKRTVPNFSYKDVAVLFRAAYLTLPLEKVFMERRMPYVIYGGVKFFQRMEIKDVLAYFNLIFNTKDDLSFKRIVNVPRRGIGDTALATLTAEKDEAGVSYYEYLSNITEYDTSLKTKAVIALSGIVNAVENVKKELAIGDEPYPSILQKFIEDIGYFEYLKSDDDGDDRIENVQTLLGDIFKFFKDNPESKFEEYLENATLQSAQDEVHDEDKISLMTIHVAKGLEFDNVFVMGLNEYIFPSQRTIDESREDGLEEERRLCYVAFTRAKKRLFVSANGSYSFIAQENLQESRFVREAELGRPLPKSSFNSGPGQFNKPALSKDIWAQYFQEDNEPTVKPVNTISDNGIRDWRAGDKLTHDKFGPGTVIKVIDDSILEIDFDNVGKKQIIASSKMLKRTGGTLDA